MKIGFNEKNEGSSFHKNLNLLIYNFWKFKNNFYWKKKSPKMVYPLKINYKLDLIAWNYLSKYCFKKIVSFGKSLFSIQCNLCKK